MVASLALAGGAGCAVSVSALASPAVDTTGHFGTEERLQLSSAAGTPPLRFFVAVAGGGGYLDGPRSGFATISPEVGVEGGRKLQWSASAFYAPRFLLAGPGGVLDGGGVAGHLLFRVQEGGGEHSGFLLGPRLSAEVIELDASRPESGAAALFQLGLVLRWTAFDTTGNSWTR